VVSKRLAQQSMRSALADPLTLTRPASGEGRPRYGVSLCADRLSTAPRVSFAPVSFTVLKPLARSIAGRLNCGMNRWASVLVLVRP